MTKFIQTLEIRENECDNRYQLRLGSIWDYFQNIASKHANALGFGFVDMSERGFTWILNRMSAEIKRYPKCEEIVKVTTQPVGISGLFAIRKYNIYDQSGTELVSACGVFIVVDINTFRPQRPATFSLSHPIFESEYKGELPHKIPELENPIYMRDFRAEFSDIDINNHTNNSRYINWVENLILPQIGDQRVSYLCANYLHDIKLGETMRAYQSENIVELRNIEERPVFRCEVRY